MYNGYMVPNSGFWAHYFRQVNVPAIQGCHTGAHEKVAPAFAGIAEEADAATEAEFERLGSMPAYSSIDMGDIAEWATDHGIAYYETMTGVRQGVLNLLAVGLHDLFEQQQNFFLRREWVREEKGSITPEELEKRLAACGVECQSFACAGKLYELRMATNAIKHGAGKSASKLAKLRPDLFLNSVLAQLGGEKGDDEKTRRAEAMATSFIVPLAGNDLYVSEHDLSEWSAAVMAYWQELSAILDEQQRQHVVTHASLNPYKPGALLAPRDQRLHVAFFVRGDADLVGQRRPARYRRPSCRRPRPRIRSQTFSRPAPAPQNYLSIRPGADPRSCGISATSPLWSFPDLPSSSGQVAASPRGQRSNVA